MSEKTLKSRIVNKHDTEAKWKSASTFVPKQGEIIIYDKDSTHTYERFKIGDGVTTIGNLPFADQVHIHDDYMANVDPVGMGSLSLNRQADTIIGANSVAVGSDATASGNCACATGWQTVASGDYSHAEGSVSTASAQMAHAEGYHTNASGLRSHAEGYYTTASGNSAHAEGYYTIANGDYQHVEGEFNIADTTSAHIVGNGTSSARSNAHTLDFEGNAWFAGDVYVGSASGANKDEGSVKLVTQDDLDSHTHTGYQSTITGGASSIVSSNLIVNRALVSNSSGKVAVSAVTSTELGYLNGVTSNIQTQLDFKATSSTTLAGYGITNAYTKTEVENYVTSQIGAFLNSSS